MASYTFGLDYLTTAPGECENMFCPICTQVMKAQRDCTGPTGWAEAIAQRGHPHDTFTCVNYAEDWHQQLVKLRQYKDTIPSAAVRKLVEEEMSQILDTKQSTL